MSERDGFQGYWNNDYYNYLEFQLMDMTRKYKTRTGNDVFNLTWCPQNSEGGRILGMVMLDDGSVMSCSWYPNGMFKLDTQSDLDLEVDLDHEWDVYSAQEGM